MIVKIGIDTGVHTGWQSKTNEHSRDATMLVFSL